MVFKKILVIGLLVIFMLALSSNAYSAVLINEILANGLNDPDSEWVELFNNNSFPVSLANWNISETSSSNFTLNATIPVNGFIILAGDSSIFNQTYPNVKLNGINIINITLSNFNLADTSGEVRLYNSSGSLVDSVAYAQASGKAFENISVGRYPDGNSAIFNLSVLTPGGKNDKQSPNLNKWLKPSGNNTKISALTNITVNITDDTSQVNLTIVNFNGTNFSMIKNGDIWFFPWNTSLNSQKQYNITLFFNDSYGLSSSDKLFNVSVNNSPFIVSFSPSSLNLTLMENSTLNFNANASDPDDAALNFSWFIDNALNSTSITSFSYTPSFNDNGTHKINATVKDSSSNQLSILWNVRVTNFNIAPVLSGISNMSGTKNITLSFNITASDPDNDVLNYSSNHSGISVSKINDSIAAVTWKPKNTDIGNNTIAFSVTDGISADFEIIMISVNFSNNAAPFITSSPVTTATQNQLYAYDADAVDLEADTLFFSVKSNISGISINSSTGLVSFTPSASGFFEVNLSVTDLIATTSQIYNLTVANASAGGGAGGGAGAGASSSGSRLKIIDLDVEVDNKKSNNVEDNEKISREAEPGSKVELKIKVFNNFTKSEGLKIEDITVDVTIEEIDNGDDLEGESKEFDLSAQNDKTVTLKFDVPLNVDEDTFDIVIKAEGEDENGTGHEHEINVELEVEKDTHDLRFLNFDINPSTAACSREISLNYRLINTGQEDEEHAYVKIKNDNLGLDIVEKDIFLLSGTEDNIFSKSLKLKIGSDAESGAYPVIANAYGDDEKILDTKTKEIVIGDCIKTGAAEGKVELSSLGPSGKSNLESAKKPIGQITEILFKGSDRNMQLLAFSTFIFAAFFVFTSLILYARL
ncbi:lamin tail domain-containing protein [Candidatus Woesearchaeota archaeon]|nr:lamin tail domain-containing protein [Candidatus Woesearchaeota archaeon]